MKRNDIRLIRILVAAGLGIFVLCTGIGWIIARMTHAVLINDNPLSLGALLGVRLALLLIAVAFIGAVIRLGQLHQWGWFITLLALIIFLPPLGVIAFMIYLIIGPDTPAISGIPSEPTQQ